MKKTEFKPEYSSDLLICKDFIVKEEQIKVRSEIMLVHGYFPYETARITMDSWRNMIMFPRVMLFDLEMQLLKINIHDNKYVVVIRSGFDVWCYYFHDNDVVVGRIEHLLGYDAQPLKIVDRYRYLAIKLQCDYDMQPEQIKYEIDALMAGKRGLDISDKTANAITSPYFLKLYGSEADYHRNKIN